MAQFKQWFEQDFTDKIEIHHCESVMFTGDDKGALVGVRLYDNGVAYSGGGAVTGAVKRLDGGRVVLTGTLSGNAASVVIPAAALAYAGPIGVQIILTVGSQKTTVLKAIYNVDDTSGVAVDPGELVPDIDELLAEIENMRTATADALAAAAAANTKNVLIRGELDDNASLDDITTPGMYWKGTTQTATGIPADLANNTAFVLIVYRAHGGREYTTAQTLIPWGVDHPDFYTRIFKTSSAFGSWAKYAKTTDFAPVISALRAEDDEIWRELNNIVKRNLVDFDSIVSGGYYNGSNVVVSNNSSAYCSAYLRVDNSKTYKTNRNASMQILTYNSDKEFIERIYNQDVPSTFTLGQNVKYIRVSLYNSTFDGCVIATVDDYGSLADGEKYIIPTDEIKNGSISEIKTSFFSESPNILNPAACTTGKFIGSTQGIYTENESEISHEIPVAAGDTVYFSPPMSALYLAKYETDNTYTRITLQTTDNSYTVETGGYIRFARYQAHFPDEFMVTLNQALPDDYVAYGAYTFDYAHKEKPYSGRVSKTSTQITVNIGDKWRVYINRYDSPSIRAYLWRLSECAVKDASGAYQRVWNSADVDGVVKLLNEDDFLGGLHGDETQTTVKFFVDGTEYNGSATFYNLKFDELLLYFESDVYHCNTSATPNAVAFKRRKIIRFCADGYSIENHWIAQESLTVINAYMGMLTVHEYAQDGTTAMMKQFIGNDNCVMRSPGDIIEANRRLTGTEYITAYGNIGIAISDITPDGNYSGHVQYYPELHRNKTYFDLAGAANLSLQSGDILHAKAAVYFGHMPLCS